VINWTITPEVELALPGAKYTSTFWEVNGEGAEPNSAHQDPYDARHFPTQRACLAFLHDRMKMGDTLHIDGEETGRILRISLVKIGDKFEYDVGTTQLRCPEELLDWMDSELRPGDTVAYLA
jgi:hypothetical protein